MSIHVQQIDIGYRIHVTDDPHPNECMSIENFKALIRRGLNTWDDAPPELKQLGDMLDHGRILQTYDTVRLLNLSSNDVGADQYPGLGGEDLPLCPICGARGLAHHYNCPTMIKDNAISEEVKDN